MCASHRAVRGLIAKLTSMGEHTVTDMKAGLEHLKRGTARHVDMMLVVAEPYSRSLEAAMRFYEFLKRQGTQYHAGSARQKALLAPSHRYLKPAEHKQAAE